MKSAIGLVLAKQTSPSTLCNTEDEAGLADLYVLSLLTLAMRQTQISVFERQNSPVSRDQGT